MGRYTKKQLSDVELNKDNSIESGGSLDVESGATFEIAGTAVTSSAAELNVLNGVTADASELNVLDGATAGTAVASKAVVLDANKALDEINTAKLSMGATGAEVEVTSTPAELNGLDVSVVGAGSKFEKASLPIVADTSPHDLAIVVPDGSIIKRVFLNVATLEATGATKTVDIGISGGDEDGFLDGASVAAAGTIKGTLVSGGQTKGLLLAVDEDGAGVLVPEDYVCSAATTICYTLGAADFAEMVASVIVEYIEIA